ncbi:hypothetical protein IV203_013020 [Nitzschia inconspicua]|uniref:Immune mapped protein 2 N-terminal domain-containing protein n=1 Tax=Nitzschia inconspicua TaxID=303405 RepID=A0A9K3M552_9STRA|nr:hypothetical protein IV203_013020 [Nitzschia inconspicua]
MPTIFRRSKSEDAGEVQPGAPPRKGHLSKLFGKTNKKKKNTTSEQDPPAGPISSLEESILPVEEAPVAEDIPPAVEKAPSNDDSLPYPTEHTVASVESDASSDSECAEATPALVEDTPAVEDQGHSDEPACYLVYEPDSSGRLVEHYSKTPVADAVGRWVARGGKKIAGFKFARNAGRNVLIGSCSAGVQGRKNYCNGWCQFVKSCKVLQGDVTLFDINEGVKAMPVDVYLYYDRPNHQTVKLEPGTSLTTDKLLAVACLPRSSPFFVTNDSVDVMKWLQDARAYGYSTKI